MDGRSILSQPPNKLVEQYPWGVPEGDGPEGGAGAAGSGTDAMGRAVLRLNTALGELEQSISLVVLCEHLLPRSADFAKIDETLNAVASKFLASQEVVERKWPRLKFFTAGGPSSEPTRWLRAEAHVLPLYESSGELVEVLIVDNTLTNPAVYFMRGLCQVAELPYTLDSMLRDDAQMLYFFLSTFCTKLHAPSARADEDDVLQKRPVKGPFGVPPDAESVAARVAQDAAVDRRA